MLRDVEAAAGVLAIQIQFFNASTNREIDAEFATLVSQRFDARLRRPRRILQQPASPTDGVGGAPRTSRGLSGA